MSTKTKTTNTQTSQKSTKPPYNQQHSSPFPGETVETMKTLNEIVNERTEYWDMIANEYGQYGCPYWEYEEPTPKEPTPCPFCNYAGSKCTCPRGSPTELNNYMSRSWEEEQAEWDRKHYDPWKLQELWYGPLHWDSEEEKLRQEAREKAWQNLLQSNVKTKNIFAMRKDQK